MGKLADRNRRHEALRRCVDHTDRVVAAVGDVGQAAVGRHHHMSRVHANRHLGDDCVATGIDGPDRPGLSHRIMVAFGHALVLRSVSRLIGLAVVGHPYELAVGRYLYVVRHLADAHVCERFERSGIEHAHRVSAFIGHIHLVSSGQCDARPSQQADLYRR